MLKSEEYKVIFIHNQKAAGMSIEKYFYDHVADTQLLLPRHAYALDGIEKVGRDNWNNYYSFGFVRNPWARIVSWYTMIAERPDDGEDNKLWQYVRENSSGFEDFLENCTDTVTREIEGFVYKKSFVKNQMDYFTDKKGKIAVNFIGKFENLKEDFEKIKKEARLPDYELPLVNPTQKKDYREYYTEHTQKLVTERFKKDIEYFGYQF